MISRLPVARGQFNKSFTRIIYKFGYCFQTLNNSYSCKSFIKLTPARRCDTLQIVVQFSSVHNFFPPFRACQEMLKMMAMISLFKTEGEERKTIM